MGNVSHEENVRPGAEFLVWSDNEGNRDIRVVENILSPPCCFWLLHIPEYIAIICKDCNK